MKLKDQLVEDSVIEDILKKHLTLKLSDFDHLQVKLLNSSF